MFALFINNVMQRAAPDPYFLNDDYWYSLSHNKNNLSIYHKYNI